MNRQRKRKTLMAEINITPFTDVVLVLLIIFMIATPLIYQSGITVQLPQAAESSGSPAAQDIVVTVNDKGEVWLENVRLDLALLPRKITAMVQSRPGASVIVNGDRNVKYDAVIQVMDSLTRAGVRNPALGIEIKREEARKRR